MNKTQKILIILSIVGIGLSFAQNMSLSVRTQLSAPGQKTNTLTLDFRLPQQLQQGVVISLSDSTAQLVLTHCRVDGKELWLKKSPQQPAGAQAANWTWQKGELIVRLNKQVLTAGRQLSFSVVDFTRKEGPKKASVFALKMDGLVPIKGRLLGMQTF